MRLYFLLCYFVHSIGKIEKKQMKALSHRIEKIDTILHRRNHYPLSNDLYTHISVPATIPESHERIECIDIAISSKCCEWTIAHIRDILSAWDRWVYWTRWDNTSDTCCRYEEYTSNCGCSSRGIYESGILWERECMSMRD